MCDAFLRPRLGRKREPFPSTNFFGQGREEERENVYVCVEVCEFSFPKERATMDAFDWRTRRGIRVFCLSPSLVSWLDLADSSWLAII